MDLIKQPSSPAQEIPPAPTVPTRAVSVTNNQNTPGKIEGELKESPASQVRMEKEMVEMRAEVSSMR